MPRSKQSVRSDKDIWADFVNESKALKVQRGDYFKALMETRNKSRVAARAKAIKASRGGAA